MPTMEWFVFFALLLGSTHGIPIFTDGALSNSTNLPEERSYSVVTDETKPSLTWHIRGDGNTFNIYTGQYDPHAQDSRSRNLQVNNSVQKTMRSDYKVTPGIGAHKLHTERLPWNQARKMCIAEGGNLAVINSDAEEKVLTDMMRSVSDWDWKKLAIVGTHDLFEEGDWVTVTGESVIEAGYARWSRSNGIQPNNLLGKQNCGSLHMEGGMNDLDCSDKERFFCEIPITPSVEGKKALPDFTIG